MSDWINHAWKPEPAWKPTITLEPITPMQREVFVWVSRGHATAPEVEAALAQAGFVRKRRAVQAILRRMCVRGYLKAVRFPARMQRRGHYHVVTPEGREAFDKPPLTPTTAAPLSEAECPPPQWAREGTGVTRLSGEDVDRMIAKYMPNLARFATLLRESKEPNLLGRLLPQTRLPRLTWRQSAAGIEAIERDRREYDRLARQRRKRR